MQRPILATLALMCTASTASAQNVPADEANNRLIRSHAIEAVIWGMPAVNRPDASGNADQNAWAWKYENVR